jgi:alpha-glucosidase
MGLYPILLNQGVRGFWHDMNEPSTFVGWGKPTLPDITMHDLSGKSGNHLEGNNLYGLFMNQAGYEGLRKYDPDHRPWLLSRSGWAGTQRYAWNWTADVASSWQTLRQTLATMLGIGLSGIPFTGSDIGGFSGHPSPELFIRWFQLASLTPFFRGHSATGTPRREPWVYGEPYTSIVRKWLEERYRLLPYLYTLSWEAHKTGAPLMRPLFWAFEDHPSFDEVDDQFMLGDALLVAPVLQEGMESRKVQFPPGVWYSYRNDHQFEGPGEVDFPTTLDEIPLFVRGGYILPTARGSQISLHIYPPGPNQEKPIRISLYSDCGDGSGPYRLDHFVLLAVDGKVSITRAHEGAYPFPYETIVCIFHGLDTVKRVLIDGQKRKLSDQQIVCRDFHTLEWQSQIQ